VTFTQTGEAVSKGAFILARHLSQPTNVSIAKALKPLDPPRRVAISIL